MRSRASNDHISSTLLIWLASAATMLLGALALLGWRLDIPALASISPTRIPMAPSTGALFLLYGSTVFLRAIGRRKRAAIWAGLTLNLAGGLVALLLLSLSLASVYLDIEHLGFRVPEGQSNVPLGHMSPVTAVCFLLASLSYGVSIPFGRHASLRSAIGQAIAGLTVAAGLVMALAYLVDSPLFYSDDAIPPAATTSLAFVTLGVALILVAGVQGRVAPEPEPPSPYPFVAFLCGYFLVSIAILGAMSIHLRSFETRYRNRVGDELAAISESKISELVQWRQERLDDAMLLCRNEAFVGAVRDHLSGSHNRESREPLETWLQPLIRYGHYAHVCLYDTNGAEIVCVPEALSRQPDTDRARVREAVAPGDVHIRDFYRDARDGRVYLSVVAPITSGAGDSIIGSLQLTIDPEAYVFPMMRRWPLLSDSGETLMIRREEDQATYLNPVRFLDNMPLELRLPLTRLELPSVQAVLGKTGVVEGRDYRGEAVMGYVRAVPDSPWLLVSKIDAVEAFAPLRDHLRSMLALVALLLLIAGVLGTLLWRQQSLRFYRQEYEMAYSLRESEERYRQLVESLEDEYIFYRHDAQGVASYVSPSAANILGYVPQLGADKYTDFLTDNPINARALELTARTFRGERQPPYLLEFRHRDGSARMFQVNEVPVLDRSGNVVAASGIAHDVTLRLQMEERLRRLNRLYAVLSETNQAIVRTRSILELFAQICAIVRDKGGFRLAWIGLLRGNPDELEIVAHAERVSGDLQCLDMEKTCGIRAVMPRLERTICNDGGADEAPPLAQLAATRLGLRSAAAFPLVVSGVLRGVIAFHAEEEGAFDDAEENLLTELALDASFAIEVAEKEEQRDHAHQLLYLQGSALSAASHAMVVTDASGNIAWANPAFTKLTGYTMEEAQGRNSWELVCAEPNEQDLRSTRAAVLKNGAVWRGEMTNRKKDGSVYVELQTTTPVPEQESGRILHYIEVREDVTELRRAEREAFEAQERLERAVEAGRVGLWEWNLKDDTVTMSAGGANLVGYGALLRHPDWLCSVHPDDRERAERNLEAIRQNRQPARSFEARFKRNDGTYAWLLTQATVMCDAAGTPIRALGTYVDISEQKSLQEQVLRAQKMESVGRLAGGIAHDFNNLLGIIMGHAALVKYSLPEDHPAVGQIGNIDRAVEKAAALTRQLLAFSRRQVLRPEILSLNELVADVAGMIDRVIGKDIEMTLRLEEHLDPIRADRSQIEQVIMNLAVNARDAMPSGGRLIIETRHAELDDAYADQHLDVVPGKYVQLSVIDNGIGMDHNTLERIFDPFFTTKEDGKGTGLGLATVYGVLKQSGGSIWVYSEPGKGTTFKVYLPCAGNDTPAPAHVSATKMEGNETILVVEDEASVRSLVKRILSRAGFDVLVAAGGEEALQMLGQYPSPIHLMLTDMVMPGITGHELASQAQELRPELRIVYMSGYSEDAATDTREPFLGARFISKPFTAVDLVAKIREALDSTVA